MSEFLHEFDFISPVIIIIRLLCSILAGFFIGFERERHNQPAGLRTHMVLALGASMIMILSIYIPIEYMHKVTNADPGRLAAQVISGIGFLGAGAILRFGFNVKGLTTAASIWTTSGIGLAFGAGYYFLGAVSTILLLIILHIFDKLEDVIIRKSKIRIIKVVFESQNLFSSKIIDSISDYGIDIKTTSLTENIDTGTTEIDISCNIDEKLDINKLVSIIKSLGYIKKIIID